MRRKPKKHLICFLLLATIAMSIMSPLASLAASGNTFYSSVEELEGKKIAVLTGSILDKIAAENIVNCDIKYFNNNADPAAALEQNLVDAYLNEEPIARCYINQYKDQAIIDTLTHDNYAFFLKKDDPKAEMLCRKLNNFLRESEKSGLLEYLKSKWMGSYEEVKTIDFSEVQTGENGILEFATSTDAGVPFSYIKDGKFAGYDIELAVEFCKANGYGIHITNYAFSSLLNTVQVGLADFAAACVTITEERKQSVLFSEPNYNGGIVVVGKTAENANIASLEELEGCTVGILKGSKFDKVARENIKDCEVSYYDNFADISKALNAKKIDAYIADEPVAEFIRSSNPNHQIINRILDEQYGLTFKKDDEKATNLCNEFNSFLLSSQKNNFIKELENKWIYGDEEDKTLVNSTAESSVTRGTIVYGTSTDVGAPFCYYKDGEIVGYEIELVSEFCKEYGYNLEIKNFDVNGVLSCVQDDKADFAGACISITEERKESILFSDPIYEGGVVVVALKNEDYSNSNGVFSSLISSIKKTFIKEDRWKLFLEGIGITMLITVVSLLLGTVLGFFVFMLCRNGNRFANTIAKICFMIVHRLPTVVLLMILYYIILGKIMSNGIIVSIICFTITFAAAFFGLVKSGVNAVGREQYEAAYTLGFSDRDIFMKIILPQSAQHFLPLLRSEVVTHIKATAIVGYIAVSDLTRMSDIVRSRTYEAFFPLISTAIIYFLLEGLLVLIVQNIEFNMNTRKRKPEKIMKGIKTI